MFIRPVGRPNWTEVERGSSPGSRSPPAPALAFLGVVRSAYPESCSLVAAGEAGASNII